MTNFEADLNSYGDYDDLDESERGEGTLFDDIDSPTTVGCLFPSECLMPGEHFPSECHTAEMVEDNCIKQEDPNDFCTDKPVPRYWFGNHVYHPQTGRQGEIIGLYW